MSFGTNPGGVESQSGVYLAVSEGKNNEDFIVHVVAEAPKQYKPNAPENPVKTKPVMVNSGQSIQLVMATADGRHIDYSIPVNPIEGTAWTEELVSGMLNSLAECTAVVPGAVDNGIPGSKYSSEGVFLRDILTRGGWFKIRLGRDKKNPQYSRFGRFMEACAEPDGAEVAEDEIPF
ncbi:MAG: hypothetical protein JW384_02789 [Nitrosomonadaceae bacterium]|nr:hypothetical protein [Nitrosomonadaceae bacterium]